MTTDVRTGYKVLTHDLRSPLQGGDPLWSGPLPVTLPAVALDTSAEECAPGWNYTGELSTALRIAGLWSDGWPSRAFAVEAVSDAIERGEKRRSSVLTVPREVAESEIAEAVRRMSEPFGDLAEEMTQEQMAWRRALSRPERDEAAVDADLRAALKARGLTWTLRQF